MYLNSSRHILDEYSGIRKLHVVFLLIPSYRCVLWTYIKTIYSLDRSCTYVLYKNWEIGAIFEGFYDFVFGSSDVGFEDWGPTTAFFEWVVVFSELKTLIDTSMCWICVLNAVGCLDENGVFFGFCLRNDNCNGLNSIDQKFDFEHSVIFANIPIGRGIVYLNSLGVKATRRHSRQ